MKYKLQIEKLKQLKMNNTEKALQVLIDAEIKETDFKNEAIYKTVINNLTKIFDNTDKLKNSIFNKNKLIFDFENKLQRRDIMIKDLDEQITNLKKEQENILNKTMKVYKIFGIKVLTVISCHTQARRV